MSVEDKSTGICKDIDSVKHVWINRRGNQKPSIEGYDNAMPKDKATNNDLQNTTQHKN
jgi:hypothetical protein